MVTDKEKTELKGLIAVYLRNQSDYKSVYNDTESLKKDCILTFFKILGWDVLNRSKQSASRKDVFSEDTIVIPGKPKPPDYSFRINGSRKFFVEVRNPSFPIFNQEECSFQLRRYGYTSNLSLSILTDFEEYAIYYTSSKPKKEDTPAEARILYFTLKDFFRPCSIQESISNFEWMFNTFSKTAVMDGSIEEFIQSYPTEKYPSGPDKEFLKRIDEWRFVLAREIASLNQNLTVSQINYAVQKMLDRFIVLRITEDLNMEKYAILYQASLMENVYKRLKDIFRKADEKFDSKIFRSDLWLETIEIGDEVLFSIIQQLYYPDSPFEFSVFSIQLLEDIFEQFLSKTILFPIKNENQNKVPEIVKVSQGYNTPIELIEYMVKETVGKELKNKTIAQVHDLKIIDPFCRTGKFLVSAFDYLLRFYQSESKSDEKIWIPDRQNILLRHIFAMDPDPHAIEITKMSILLKVIENISKNEYEPILKNPHLQILPDFHHNLATHDTIHSLFKDILEKRMDVLIGVPPSITYHNNDPVLNAMKVLHGKWLDLSFFINQAFTWLKPNGWISFLVDADTFILRGSDRLIYFLVQHTLIHEILFIDKKADGSFPSSCLLVLQNQKPVEFISAFGKSIGGARTHIKQQAINMETLKKYAAIFFE